ncbi:MAG: preprotein translocase subunit SecY [Oscillospiraceae bacterium]|nr:preprotein translocase subunit SecY [Oscillospiraceae bacterium]
MFKIFRNAFALPDLKRKILYTLFILVLFRVGAAFPVPFLDPGVIRDMAIFSGEEAATDILGYLNLLTGGALENGTVFAMSITPYINASIIMQLLTVAIPALERLKKEGEEGRKKIGRITRYATIALAVIQGYGYFAMLSNTTENKVFMYQYGWRFWFAMVVIVMTFTVGTAVIVFMGELITENGIGNGISLILFAGIISRGPDAIIFLWSQFQIALNGGDPKFYYLIPLIVVIFIAMIVFIVIMTNAERRIPVSYAKRVVGRKMYGGQSTHIPIKVNMSGVMPIIFASSFLMLPSMIRRFVNIENEILVRILSVFDYTSWTYAGLYFMLIIAFNYFYVAIQYNPVEIANNLRKNNGAIPGIRPGKPTSDFISKVLSKITLFGALFLGFIATFPIMYQKFTEINVALGGTSILIVVGVALDTMRTLESQMMMRHHKGFLE